MGSNPAWIVGNGPSLNRTPLHLLRGKVSFGIKLIHLHYSCTDWRPTHYVAFDFFGVEPWQMIDALLTHANMGCRCYVRADRATALEPPKKQVWPTNVTYHWTCSEHLGSDVDSGRRPEAWHLPRLCPYGSTLNVATQIAVLEGFNPIVYVGCDLGFVEPVKGEPDPNHMSPDYHTHCDHPWDRRDATLINMHEIIERETMQLGVKVYNVTFGGLLDVHERIPFEEALEL